MRLRGWLDERTGLGAGLRVTLDHPVLGGASFAYVMGAVLLFLLVLQGVTGALLAFYYSPSATDAWASVAYVEDRVTLGWLVRGLHHHGASAMVIAAITVSRVSPTSPKASRRCEIFWSSSRAIFRRCSSCPSSQAIR